MPSTFVIGGARSGKSAFALRLANALEMDKVYIATATAYDDEMRERIELHKKERSSNWTTIEEPIGLAGALKPHVDCAVVIDCLTLWISNLMHAGLTDEAIEQEALCLCSAIKSSSSRVFLVSNEVGLGIVPDNALARRFRDASGRVNALVADACDEVYFMAAGLPMKMK